jgi:hypothetical protein
MKQDVNEKNIVVVIIRVCICLSLLCVIRTCLIRGEKIRVATASVSKCEYIEHWLTVCYRPLLYALKISEYWQYGSVLKNEQL